MDNRNMSRANMNYYVSLLLLLISSFPTTAAWPTSMTRILRLFYLIGLGWALIVFVTKRYYGLRKLYPVLIMLPWFIICSVINTESSVQKCAYMCIRMFVVIILMQYMLHLKGRRTIIHIGNIWSVFMIIQLISLLTGFMGTTSSQNTSVLEQFFFGIRVEINEYIIYAIAFCLFAVMLGGFKEKILAVLTIFAAVYFSFYEWVSTSISGLGVFFAVLLLSRLFKKGKIWRFAGVLILLLAMVVPFMLENGILSWYVVDVLGEDLTFNGRTVLWAQVFEQIKGLQIIYGKGYEPISDLWIIGKYAFVVNHPHNNYLQFYYWYGIVGLIMYLVMLVNMIKNIKFAKNNKVKSVYTAAIIANMVMAVVSRNYWYMTAQIFYVIGMNIEYIDEMVSDYDAGGGNRKRIRIRLKS